MGKIFAYYIFITIPKIKRQHQVLPNYSALARSIPTSFFIFFFMDTGNNNT